MISVENDKAMRELGRAIGEQLRGGEVIELVGDVGAGKTTLTKGIGEGLQVDDDVQSPSFTISRVYDARDGLQLHHYDLYRLTDAGLMSYELAESTKDSSAVTVIEWAETAKDVLPENRVVLSISSRPSGDGRTVDVRLPKELDYLSVGQEELV